MRSRAICTLISFDNAPLCYMADVLINKNMWDFLKHLLCFCVTSSNNYFNLINVISGIPHCRQSYFEPFMFKSTYMYRTLLILCSFKEGMSAYFIRGWEGHVPCATGASVPKMVHWSACSWDLSVYINIGSRSAIS